MLGVTSCTPATRERDRPQALKLGGAEGERNPFDLLSWPTAVQSIHADPYESKRMKTTPLPPFTFRFIAALGLAAAASSITIPGCAPEPKTVRCQNDTECAERGEGLRYCLESRCVKCASRADCPDGMICSDGECK